MEVIYTKAVVEITITRSGPMVERMKRRAWFLESAHNKVKKDRNELMKMLVESSNLVKEFYYKKYN